MTTTLVNPIAPPADSSPESTQLDLLGTLAEAANATQERARRLLLQSVTTDLDQLVGPLPPEDRQEFQQDLREALNGPFERLEVVLEEWAITAHALRDPLNRELLLGEIDAADFIEVPRPE